jgi:hypothetical protein
MENETLAALFVQARVDPEPEVIQEIVSRLLLELDTDLSWAKSE